MERTMLTREDFDKYVASNFPDVSETFKANRHITEYCHNCATTVGMKIEDFEYPTFYNSIMETRSADASKPHLILFSCPICSRFKVWLVHNMGLRTYKIASIPADDYMAMEGVPEDPAALKRAYLEALRCMQANAPIAAAAMFRRALQVITRDILKVTPSNLANELKSLKNQPNALNVILTNDFHDNAYIIKECGNQGAHPDEDPDLLDFTLEDAQNLQAIFMEVVAELFIVPEASRKAKQDFINRRKLKP